MWSFQLILLAIITTAFAHPHLHPNIAAREYVNEKTLADAYDFVIAGGGTAGLALASRLSANSNFTVLVIEAGDIGPDSVGSLLDYLCHFREHYSLNPSDTPAYSYYKSLFNTEFDYGYQTVPQPSAGGRKAYWPRGKVSLLCFASKEMIC